MRLLFSSTEKEEKASMVSSSFASQIEKSVWRSKAKNGLPLKLHADAVNNLTKQTYNVSLVYLVAFTMNT